MRIDRVIQVAIVVLGVVVVVGVLIAALQPRAVTAQLRDAQDDPVGAAVFTETPEDGVRIALTVQGLEPGEHGIHIHETGECTPPNFTSAGEHFNPSGKHHGLENPEGPHAGDLPNLTVSGSGSAVYEAMSDRVTLAPSGETSLFHSGGTSLVIHAKADDQMSDPAGNSGDRIACGVIEG